MYTYMYMYVYMYTCTTKSQKTELHVYMLKDFLHGFRVMNRKHNLQRTSILYMEKPFRRFEHLLLAIYSVWLQD